MSNPLPPSGGVRDLPPISLTITTSQTHTLVHNLGVVPRVVSVSLRATRDNGFGISAGLELDLAFSSHQFATAWKDANKVIVDFNPSTTYVRKPDGSMGLIPNLTQWELIVRVAP